MIGGSESRRGTGGGEMGLAGIIIDGGSYFRAAYLRRGVRSGIAVKGLANEDGVGNNRWLVKFFSGSHRRPTVFNGLLDPGIVIWGENFWRKEFLRHLGLV